MKYLRSMLICVACSSPVIAHGDEYNPLKIDKISTTKTIDVSIRDEKRSRDIPIRVYLPNAKSPAPVVLFSHGLGGSRDGCAYLGKHWAARGYVGVFLQHHGSDSAVWKDAPLGKRLAAMKKAPSMQNTVARFRDVSAVLDQLGAWSQQAEHTLKNRLDLERVGMSGHSYGASTTQGVSGQSAARLGQPFLEKRIDAAVMFSPNRPNRIKPEDAFGKVAIPWMLMTGTKDTSPINDTTVADRRTVYPALPANICKYELVLHNAEHSAFSDERRSRIRRRDPNHHRVILALSTAFWDAHLRNDQKALYWLHGREARKILGPSDEWQLNVPQELSNR